MAARKTGRGPGRPARGEGEEEDSSRERLIEAAATVFAARGYRAATVDAVLQEAGLSKGTFYWNFESKDELFMALVEERIERPVRALLEITRSASPEAETSQQVSSGFAALVARERDLVLLMHEFWSAAVRDDRLRDRYRERQAGLRDLIAQTLAARHETTGLVPTFPLDQLAIAYIALGEGLSLEAIVDPGLVPDGLFGEVASLIYDGLVLRAQRAEAEAEDGRG